MPKEMENKLVIQDAEGSEILCEILFTHYSEKFKKNYVLFYEVAEEDNDEIEVMAASYEEGKEGDGQLDPIENEEEWEYIEDLLEAFSLEDEDEDDECDCEEAMNVNVDVKNININIKMVNAKVNINIVKMENVANKD